MSGNWPITSHDVKERPVLGRTLKTQPWSGIVPDLGTSQNCPVVSRDVKERSAGLGASETRPDLGTSQNCRQPCGLGYLVNKLPAGNASTDQRLPPSRAMRGDRVVQVAPLVEEKQGAPGG